MKRFLLTFLVLPATTVFAGQHIIEFGVNPANSSDNLAVKKGDTITWVGDFSMYPLMSLTVPDGAIPFSVTEGTSFTYVVPTAGEYRYGNNNGSGSFSAFDFAPFLMVTNAATSLFVVQQEGRNVVYSILDNNTINYTFTIYDLSGKEVFTSSVVLNNSGYVIPQLPGAGIYILRALTDKNELYSTKILNSGE